MVWRGVGWAGILIMGENAAEWQRVEAHLTPEETAACQESLCRGAAMGVIFLAFLSCHPEAPTEEVVHVSSTRDTAEPQANRLSFQVMREFACTSPEINHETPIFRASLGEAWEDQLDGLGGEYSGWGVSVHDYNQDGLWDVFLPHFGLQDQLFLGQVDGSVLDASLLLPANHGQAYGASSVDIDDDGDVDIIVGAEGGNYIYVNEGVQGFSLLGEEVFTEGDMDGSRTHHLAIADADQDGYFDFFGPTFYSRYMAEEPVPFDNPDDNQLFWGVDKLRWEKVRGWSEVLEEAPGNAGGWVDVDDDGDLDL